MKKHLNLLRAVAILVAIALLFLLVDGFITGWFRNLSTTMLFLWMFLVAFGGNFVVRPIVKWLIDPTK